MLPSHSTNIASERRRLTIELEHNAMTTNTAAGHLHLAHHFDDVDQQYTSAELGMWLFLATEILFFGGVFCGYAVYRYWYHDAFTLGSHQLDYWLGTLNTAVLLTSSLTMALAVRAAQTNDQRGTVQNLVWTLLLGSVFLGIKVVEYRHKFEHHLVPGPNFSLEHLHDPAADRQDTSAPHSATGHLPPQAANVQLFFSFYFVMTGLHALHMVIGVAVLATLIVAASRGAFSAEYFTPVEMSGLYWHFVDIVWVFLFPLLYLIR
jgi:cytochrome c oxidase subunit 3